MSAPSVRDVAARAQVSMGTVSNALNHPEKVSPATLARIHEAITELGFIRNEAAHQLRAGVNRSIGMLVLDISNPFFTDVARGVENGLAGTGRPLLLANSGQDVGRERTLLQSFEEQRLSGLLVTPVSRDLERIRRVRDRGTHVVLVDRMSRAKDFSSVSVEDRLGGRLAAEHLLELGRRRIAYIGGPRSIEQVRARLAGAQAAVAAAGSGELVFHETPAMDFGSGRRAAELLLAEPSRARPDAIFAANDLIAIGALQALTMAGVVVPDDIALVGYDDIEFAAAAAIPLTSVRQPAVAIGETAVRILLAEVSAGNEGVQRRQHVKLKPELIVRSSTAG